MQIFIDSADIIEIEQNYDLGIISGVTTNPSLVSQMKGDFKSMILRICNAVQKKDVSVEVSSNNYDDMIIQGHKLINIAENIVIKLPLTWEGIKACKYFSSNGIKTNMTLCFTANQALIAALAGATYISPFIGRLEDISQDGVGLIKDIKLIYQNYNQNISTKILAASIRNANHFYQAAMAGADVITVSAKLIQNLINHPLTNKGLDIFNQDWQKSGYII